MCLNSKWRFPKRAKKDIVCYKILEKVETDNGDEYYTPYQDTEVDITKPFKAKGISLSFSNNTRYEKTKGYIHTISSLEYIKTYLRGFGGIKFAIFKCHIPKGTKYHESIYDVEYCSRKIVFDREVQSYEIHDIH